MTGAHSADAAGGASYDDEGGLAALVITRCLSLAAAPTFAVMALLTGICGNDPMDMLCSAGHGSALSGMTPMYVLMTAFHSSPWLKLISGPGAPGHATSIASFMQRALHIAKVHAIDVAPAAVEATSAEMGASFDGEGKGGHPVVGRVSARP